MFRVYGTSVSKGIGKGEICVYNKINYLSATDDDSCEQFNADVQLQNFHSAVEIALAELNALTENTLLEVDKDSADLFISQAAMLTDPYFTAAVIKHIKTEQLSAVSAIKNTVSEISDMLKIAGKYISERIVDVVDIANRLITILKNGKSTTSEFPSNCIIIADELTPSEAILLKKNNIIGICLYKGSENSHSSILARSMGIPLIINIQAINFPIPENAIGIIDSELGSLIISPDNETLFQYNIKFHQNIEHLSLLEQYIGVPDITPSGRKINLYANISSSHEIEAVRCNDASGIGLYRTEFFYISAEHEPTEDELFNEYFTIAKAMGEKPVIIRTLDIGADKQLEYLPFETEKNPALGIKGIRLSLMNTAIFSTQLRAILRASAFGNISIMFPMITNTWEVAEALSILSKIKSELDSENISYNKEIKIGVMIETPASVMVSDDLALMVDFFSIGTNDLLQYTLAVDREGSSVIGNFFDNHHKSILRMIDITILNAHKAGIWVGVCGELAVDPTFIQEVIKLGIDEISVPPPSILPTREIILNKNKYFS